MSSLVSIARIEKQKLGEHFYSFFFGGLIALLIEWLIDK